MWFFRKKATSAAERELDEISRLLFPEMKLETVEDGTKFYIDTSVDGNLEAALADLEDGINDETTRQTIRSITNRLYEVRQILGAFADLDIESKYLVVSDPTTPKEDEIIAVD